MAVMSGHLQALQRLNLNLNLVDQFMTPGLRKTGAFTLIGALTSMGMQRSRNVACKCRSRNGYSQRDDDRILFRNRRNLWRITVRNE